MAFVAASVPPETAPISPQTGLKTRTYSVIPTRPHLLRAEPKRPYRPDANRLQVPLEMALGGLDPSPVFASFPVPYRVTVPSWAGSQGGFGDCVER